MKIMKSIICWTSARKKNYSLEYITSGPKSYKSLYKYTLGVLLAGRKLYVEILDFLFEI